MGWKKFAFWTGVAVGTIVGYAVAISLSEEERERLRQTILAEGEDVLDTVKEIGGLYARDLSKKAVEKAEAWVGEMGFPFSSARTNGASRS